MYALFSARMRCCISSRISPVQRSCNEDKRRISDVCLSLDRYLCVCSELLRNLELNEERFIALLSKLIAEVPHLQNSPAQGLIPQEDKASDHILEVLRCFFLFQSFLT